MPKPATSSLLPIVAPICAGILAFWACVGLTALDPANVHWFYNSDDTVQSWLGWTFFRASPWTWPPGLNPDYGLELGNAIIYTDSIPLLAFFFKLFHHWLPAIFQYLGWWLLSCFILQAVFAWKLLKLVVTTLPALLVGVWIFLFAPIFLIRLGGHYTLVGQFMILAGLYLCLQKKTGPWHYPVWLGLLALGSLTHAYFLFMLGILWGADLLNRLVKRDLSFPKALANGMAGIGLAGIGCWLAGYFAISPGGAGGFGIYKMNLLAPFNSGGISWFIPDIPANPGEGEGFNYLGTGGLLLLGAAALGIFTGKVNCKHLLRLYWPLLLASILLTLAALSNVIGLGPYNMELPRPASWERWLQPVFRASGRFFWPVNYLLLLGCIYVVFKTLPYKWALLLLCAAALLQIGDSSRRWWPANENNFLTEQPMRSLFWTDLPYARIRIIPLQNARPDWKAISLHAALNGLKTDGVYVSRTDDLRLWAIGSQNDKRIEELKFDPDTLYILDTATFEKIKDKVPGALTEIIDGFPVLAPDYYNRIKGRARRDQ